MAKISAHGHEVGTVYFTTCAKRYMSDGVILRNDGFGWKLGGKLKPGVTPQAAFAAQLDAQQKFEAARPCLAAYRKELRAMAGMSLRWKLHTAVELMPDDADGVWSEACDGFGDNVHADIDEVSELCRLYRAVAEETAELRDPTNVMAQDAQLGA